MPTSLIRLFLVTAFTALVGACAEPPNAVECKTGITCPEGTKCAAVQQICIINDCGDGIVQSSEKCDDGNILDGDGCAANCLSQETCGDGVLNSAAGEICDDGNTTGGDGCASDCVSVEICGNGTRDVNEVCDDGNTLPGDGCSGNCKSTEVCGNNIVDVGEKCDDGSAPGGCNDDCQGGTGCGDGAIDRDGSGNALEECDDGNTENQDDCTNACNLNACGDGIVQTSGARTEQCDPSLNFGETAGCNLDCTTTMCGDNKINNKAGEECDDGPSMNADDRDCTSTCRIGICGDLLVNTAGTRLEDCDDQNTNNFDGCSNICTTPHCGNGVIEMTEACDDGNTVDGDGCSGPTTGASDPNCQFEKCGDGIKNNGEFCDKGVGGVAKEAADCNIDCTEVKCSDLKVNATAGEQCDDGNAIDTDSCLPVTCKLARCGDTKVGPGEACDDGNVDNTDGCNTRCAFPSCGNGIVDDNEECDDQNADETDGCLSTCKYATCGDMFVHAGFEQCDNGTSNNGPTKNCLASCKTNVCGDGFTDLDGTNASDMEACDDGNTNSESTCAYGIQSCKVCDSNCNTETTVSGNVCGDNSKDATNEACDDGNRTTETECPYQASSPNSCDICTGTCTLQAETGPFCGDGTTDSGHEVCDDKNATCGQCNSACSVLTAAAAATALIVASDNSGSNIQDGDTLTLNDGFNTLIFEFDEDNMFTSASNKIKIDCNSALTAKQVRDKIAAAIASADGLPIIGSNFRITTVDLGDTGLRLVNERSSSIGNTTIGKSGLGAAFFVSTAFTGGAAGDCASAAPCRDDADCLASDGTGFGTCSGTPKTCQ